MRKRVVVEIPVLSAPPGLGALDRIKVEPAGAVSYKKC